MSEAADIVELLAAGFARASRPTKVVLQRSLPRPLLPQRRAANAVSVRNNEAADTAEIGCCSVFSCMQINKGRAAGELVNFLFVLAK